MKQMEIEIVLDHVLNQMNITPWGICGDGRGIQYALYSTHVILHLNDIQNTQVPLC